MFTVPVHGIGPQCVKHARATWTAAQPRRAPGPMGTFVAADKSGGGSGGKGGRLVRARANASAARARCCSSSSASVEGPGCSASTTLTPAQGPRRRCAAGAHRRLGLGMTGWGVQGMGEARTCCHDRKGKQQPGSPAASTVLQPPALFARVDADTCVAVLCTLPSAPRQLWSDASACGCRGSLHITKAD